MPRDSCVRKRAKHAAAAIKNAGMSGAWNQRRRSPWLTPHTKSPSPVAREVRPARSVPRSGRHRIGSFHSPTKPVANDTSPGARLVGPLGRKRPKLAIEVDLGPGHFADFVEPGGGQN